MISCRQATIKDVTFIYQCEVEIFNQKIAIDLIKNDIKYHDNTAYFIAETADEVVGYLSILKSDNHIEIINIYVLKRWRNRGIGHKLFNYMTFYYQKELPLEISLEVREYNNQAIALYKSLGFKTINKRKQYYQDGEDALVMHCLYEE
ncbi:MAG: ribosomal protein S18-alanine N-acetyltransferase [Candidatus Izimaplasma sp.]|nr:ribosomal protein S18-alanine N-acetyltransferase [Candidatus Izimaplasma bacterium]